MTLGGLSKPSKSNTYCGNDVSQRWQGIFTVVDNREIETSKNNPGPRVIVMSSGMADGGPASSWMPILLRSDKNIVAMSGFCGPMTIGGKLVDLSGISADQRHMHPGELIWLWPNGTKQASIPVRAIQAKIVQLRGYSAHGDQTDLINWLFEEYKGETKQVMGKTIFLQHGEDHARKSLADAITQKAREWDLKANVIQPEDPSQWFNLEYDTDNHQNERRKIELKQKIHLLQEELSAL